MRIEVVDSLCSGCRVCILACALENFHEVRPSTALLKIRGDFPDPGTYSIFYCNQCGVCAKTCPVDAIREVDGEYSIDYDSCTACMECLEACPSQVILAREDGYPYKCSGCGRCVEVCPRDAILKK